MRIRHILPSTSSRSLTEQPVGFFLRNQTGDWLSFFNERQSRYEGWYWQQPQQFIKILERVEVLSGETPLTVQSITNTGETVFWEYENQLRLGWKLHPTSSGVSLLLSQPAKLRLHLDIRSLYQFPGLGRSYQISTHADGCTIQYADPELKEPVFLYVRCATPLRLQQSWQSVAYPRDAARHSPPTDLFVFTLGEVSTDQISLGVGSSLEQARQASLAASRQSFSLPQVGLNYTHDTLMSEVTTARATVQQGLRWLQTPEGLLAGLPWFHQVWTRDELITALGLPAEQQRQIIERYLQQPLQQGELPTFKNAPSTGADGVGWLCLLVREHGVENLSETTQEQLLRFLLQAREELLSYHQGSHGLISSAEKATWMDTLPRAGFRLEIQCMFALLLELLTALTDSQQYYQEKIRLLGRVKQLFWQNGQLSDGLGDPTTRPNIFLAYLLQPELLSFSNWQQAMETALSALWCRWGGLSSIDQTSPHFHPESTGEDNQSYHQGDSWFFMNNLAAIAMHRLSQRHFGKTVVELLQGSTQEILWHGFAGQPGEISSAQSLQSWGCGIQAFSGGTFLALLKELENYSEQSRDPISFFWDSTAPSTASSFWR